MHGSPISVLGTWLSLLSTIPVTFADYNTHNFTPRQEVSIFQMAAGTNCEMADNISKNAVIIQNMCCYTCQGQVCCCNFKPPLELCNALGCVGVEIPGPGPGNA
jgi:hypothetical protein